MVFANRVTFIEGVIFIISLLKSALQEHVWLSGRKQQTHNLSPLGHHRFKPCRMQ